MTSLRVCFVGDSLVNGTNDPDFQGWPGRLAQHEASNENDLSVYNLGIRGDTSVMIADRWQKECEARLPAIQPCALVFSFGVNDVAFANGVRRVPFETSLATARKVMLAAKSWLPTLWVGPPPVELDETTFIPTPDVTYLFKRGDIAELSEAFADVAKDIDVPYFDLYGALEHNTGWSDSFDPSDSVHPKQNGYKIISRHLQTWPAWRQWMDTDPTQ